MKQRIKYFDAGDWANGGHLKQAEKLLNNLDFSETNISIDDVLEFYNVIKIFDDKRKFDEWTEIYYNQLLSKIKELKKIVANYFNKTISSENISSLYDKVCLDYKEDFFEAFEKYKLYSKISVESFKELLNSNHDISPNHLLKNKKTVETYDVEIKNYLLSNDFITEIILDKYENKTINSKDKKIYLPSSLNENEIEEAFDKYIDSCSAHLNVLELISRSKPNEIFRLSDSLKLKAKKKAEEQSKEFFDNNPNRMLITEFLVTICDTQKESKIDNSKGLKIDLSYSGTWIDNNNKDYPTLLNNFIYLFDFVDRQMRMTFVSKESELGIVDRFMTMRSIYDYVIGTSFKIKDQVVIFQMSLYYKRLKKIKCDIENIIEWFFKDYLKNEFEIPNFKITMPKSSEDYYTKCLKLFPKMENALRQYKMYVDKGDIDSELASFTSNPLDYGSLPSVLNNNYIYGVGDDFTLAKFYLTSDQCMLKYVKNIDEKYDNFAQLLSNHTLYLANYEKFEQKQIKWLVDHNILKIDKDDKIYFKDKKRIKVLLDLSVNEVINFYHYPQNYKQVFDNLYDEGFIKYESSLLSRPEINYINYLLNRSTYNNGLDIRNRYLHGIEENEEDENIHYVNYMYGIIVFIICIIKINDELCIKFESN